jgi:hypothetical protein
VDQQYCSASGSRAISTMMLDRPEVGWSMKSVDIRLMKIRQVVEDLRKDPRPPPRMGRGRLNYLIKPCYKWSCGMQNITWGCGLVV